MHKQTHKRAFYTLAGCIAALALCVAASLFLLTPAPKAQDVTIPGTRGDIYATVQLPGKLARGEALPLVVLPGGPVPAVHPEHHRQGRPDEQLEGLMPCRGRACPARGFTAKVL